MFIKFLFPCLLFIQLGAHGMAATLEELEKMLARELHLINYRTCPWKEYPADLEIIPVYEVVIIGGGISGLSAGVALFKEGISKFIILDQQEEPSIAGNASTIPSLTFQAWYVSLYGQESWGQMDNIPKAIWMDYLAWYKKIMKLPVEKECCFTSLTPIPEGFELTFSRNGEVLTFKTHKVVFAKEDTSFDRPSIYHKAFYYMNDDWKWDLVCSAGININGYNQPELAPFIHLIDTWENHIPHEKVKAKPYLGPFPYLGEYFEFKEKIPGTAPYLKGLYCINHGTILSHGIAKAERLAKKISADIFQRTHQNRKLFYP